MLAERKKQLKITVSPVTATILAAIAFVSLGQLSQAPNNIRSATNQKKHEKAAV